MVKVKIILILKFGLRVSPVRHPVAQMGQVRPSKAKWFAWKYTASCGRATRVRVSWIPRRCFLHHPVVDYVGSRTAWYEWYFWNTTRWFCVRKRCSPSTMETRKPRYPWWVWQPRACALDVPSSLIPQISKSMFSQALPLKWTDTMRQGQLAT